MIAQRWRGAPRSHRILLVSGVVSAVFVGGLNVAQSQSEPTPAYPAAEKHKPSTLADRVVLTYEGDPATTQSVTWRTDTTVKTAQAQIAKAGEGPGFKSSASTVLATRNVEQPASLGFQNVFHTVRFTALEPETKYLYRLGDGTNWSEWYEFQTAAATAEPFSFIYYGDAQNDIQEHWSRVVRLAFAAAPDARLMVHAGDLIDSSNNDAQWGEWFTASGWINGMRPSFATPGNHEYSGTTLAPYWRTQFAFPENGPQGQGAVYDALKGTVFYTDYQGVRFISLNSNVSAVASAQRDEFLTVQAQWLETILQNNPNKWSVVTFHHPMFSTAEGRNNPTQRAKWLPIFERYGVDLVLQGHDHSYGRGNVVAGASAQSGNGTIYVVSVSGPKMYEANDSNWVSNGAVARNILMNTQLYQVISVDGTRLSYEARTATGRLHDKFTIDKPASGTKTIIEDLEQTKTQGVGGAVASTLSLTLDGAANFGAFTPGDDKDYETALTAKVTSTAGDAALSLTDPSTTAPGKLVNGDYSLQRPVQAKAASAAASTPAGAFAPVGSSALSLLGYVGPVSNDPVTISLKQSITASEALRTGNYTKTLTLALSTTAP